MYHPTVKTQDINQNQQKRNSTILRINWASNFKLPTTRTDLKQDSDTQIYCTES